MSSQCLSVDDGDRLLDLSKRVASVWVEARCARTTYDSSRYAGRFGGGQFTDQNCMKIFLPPPPSLSTFGTVRVGT